MPEDPPRLPCDPETLRRRAEHAATPWTADEELPPPDRLPQLIHDLRVHQIELQMQNEALQEAQAALETSRDRYADLYDFAPVGYITLDQPGVISEINLTAADMLGAERSRLLGHRLARYIHPAEKARFVEFLRGCWRTDDDQELTAEFTLGGPLRHDLPVLVRVATAASPHTGQPQCRMTLTDIISTRKRSEDALRALNQTLEQRVAERTAAVRMLRDIASMANRSQHVDEAIRMCLQRVAEHAGWQYGQAWLPLDGDPALLVPADAWYPANSRHFDPLRQWSSENRLRRGECLSGLVYATGEPRWMDDLSTGLAPDRAAVASVLGMTAAAAFPVRVERRIVGVLEFFSDAPIGPDAETLGLMTSVGTQLGRVIERKAFQDCLLTLSDDEHRRIGQELHDDVGQELTGLALQLETLAETLDEKNSPEREPARKIMAAVARIRRKTRNLSRGLIPMEIDAPALETALEALAVQASGSQEVIACHYRSQGNVCVAGRHTATQLYRIAQEAISHAVEHAKAKHVEIELEGDPRAAVLEIRDDGQDMATDPAMDKGLQIMRYRAGMIGGTLTVQSLPTGGTRVRCRVPCKKAD